MGKPLAGRGVQSAELTLDVLEAVALSGEWLGVTEIASRVKATKGSVFRHLCTLVDRGYLAQDSHTARYGMGERSRLLARLVPEVDLTHTAEDLMRDLRDELNHTVVLSAMTPRGALVLSTLHSKSSIEIGVRAGSELSFHASAQGKVMLAYASDAIQQRVIQGPLEAFTAKTNTNPAMLIQELGDILTNGYSSASEEVLLGINSIAAPIFNESNACVASVALVGSIQHLTAEYEEIALTPLKRCARDISARLGNRLKGKVRSHR